MFLDRDLYLLLLNNISFPIGLALEGGCDYFSRFGKRGWDVVG